MAGSGSEQHFPQFQEMVRVFSTFGTPSQSPRADGRGVCLSQEIINDAGLCTNPTALCRGSCCRDPSVLPPAYGGCIGASWAHPRAVINQSTSELDLKGWGLSLRRGYLHATLQETHGASHNRGPSSEWAQTAPLRALRCLSMRWLGVSTPPLSRRQMNGLPISQSPGPGARSGQRGSKCTSQS